MSMTGPDHFDLYSIEKARNMAWESDPKVFVQFVRLILGMDPQGEPPYATLLSAIRHDVGELGSGE
jgi:hypothetical protein